MWRAMAAATGVLSSSPTSTRLVFSLCRFSTSISVMLPLSVATLTLLMHWELVRARDICDPSSSSIRAAVDTGAAGCSGWLWGCSLR